MPKPTFRGRPTGPLCIAKPTGLDRLITEQMQDLRPADTPRHEKDRPMMDQFDRQFKAAQRGQMVRTIVWAGVACFAIYVALQIFA